MCECVLHFSSAIMCMCVRKREREKCVCEVLVMSNAESAEKILKRRLGASVVRMCVCVCVLYSKDRFYNEGRCYGQP